MSDSTTADIETPETPSPVGDAPLQWAPAAPTTRRPRWGLRIGVPAGVFTVGAVAASLILIAPGTAVAGVPVGFLTEGAAGDAISRHLAETVVQLGEGGPTVTGAQLGATVDAGSLAGAAYHDRPLWNVASWFGDAADAEVSLDADAATAALQNAAPELYTAPTPAAVSFDGTSYVVEPAVNGEGLDVEAVRTALQEAFAAGRRTVVVDPAPAVVTHPASTVTAQEAADRLNGMLADVGFYVGDERVVPIDAAQAASWMTVGFDDAGTLTMSADAAAVQAALDAIAGDIDQEAVRATVVTNSSGDVLRTMTEGQDGRVLGDTTGLADGFADQLASANGRLALPVDVTPHETKELERMLEVDLSQQRLYLKENGRVVDTWLVSSGRSGAETHTGNYRIGWKTSSQTMRGTSRDTGTVYEQPDVPWVMYFNGDQAFHGAYWHNNFGHRMSAGCVNMPPAKAKKIYDWSPEGVDVWIHG